jgi:hypothetical protein
VLQPHEVAAVAAVGPGGAPAFVLQVRPALCLPVQCIEYPWKPCKELNVRLQPQWLPCLPLDWCLTDVTLSRHPVFSAQMSWSCSVVCPASTMELAAIYVRPVGGGMTDTPFSVL